MDLCKNKNDLPEQRIQNAIKDEWFSFTDNSLSSIVPPTMKLILLGFLALAYAMPDGLDKPCRPGEHCPRKRPLPRQSTNATCGTHSQYQ